MIPTFTTSKPPRIPQSFVADNGYSKVFKAGKFESLALDSTKVVGTATLVSGTVDVTIPGIESTDLVFVNMHTHAGTSGTHYEVAFNAAVGSTPAYITINSIDTAGDTVTTDTSVVKYLVVKPVA